MGLFSRFFKKNDTTPSTYVETSSSNKTVRIISDHYLPEDVRDVIASVVIADLTSRATLEKIQTDVIVYSGIYSVVTLKKTDNGIEVSIY